ncbi:hypothetical protein D1007_00195 [Hordeum vulgare]|nr:hypothetical protein D1007_00195 [Hordeum vulgare]
MKSTSYDSAWDFYNNYARYGGFGTRKKSKHKTNAYIICPREGTHKHSVSYYDQKHDKTSKSIGCKAGIRIKSRKNGTSGIERVELNHNHNMLESPRILLHIHSHKRDDPLIDQLAKDMQFRLSVGRKEKFAREESEAHVKKLLEFFKNMKKTNLEFFYDYNVDADKRVKNNFLSNANCTQSYKDFGNCITFDTT